MKLIDKLKNALFEEEYVEVEEKPKKKVVKKEPKPIKKEKIREPEEKPIAKKIVPPERKEVKITHHEDIEDHHEGESLATPIEKNEFKFPLVSDNEFKEEKEEIPVKKEIKVEPQTRREEPRKKAYGIDDMNIPEPTYGAYEKKEERTHFKPSPIISPIYGVLDKNYKKEEIIPKREVRLTSTYARENLDLDEVRQRAFGTLSDDIARGPDLEQYEIEEESNFRDTDLFDLSEEKPEVKKVTVGDAEEYFEDLGLEYNVDYKDMSKETRIGRRYQEEIEEPEIIEETPIIKTTPEEISIKKEVVEETSKESETLDEDNLFDLIDSMYEKE